MTPWWSAKTPCIVYSAAKNAERRRCRRTRNVCRGFGFNIDDIVFFHAFILIGGPIGSILFDIPLVVICVLLASLFECFMVLPGHLWHAFDKIKAKGVGASRQRLESGVENFQEKIYRPCVALAVRYRGAT